jgi:hypothetical protein
MALGDQAKLWKRTIARSASISTVRLACEGFNAAIKAHERGGHKGQTRLKSGEECREASFTFGYILTRE